MGLETSIGWCDGTFNPWSGCSECSPGCHNCYARTVSLQNPQVLGVWGREGEGGTRVVRASAAWEDVLKAQRKAKQTGKRYRMFCGSMMDVFEDWGGPMHDHKGKVLRVSAHGSWGQPEKDADKSWTLLTMDAVRARLLTLVCKTPDIDWLMLTKRPKNIAPTLRRVAHEHRDCPGGLLAGAWADGNFPPNVWVGASAENQTQLWLRAEQLRDAPARLRFISAEPLLGPLDFAPWFGKGTGLLRTDPFDWVIVGGESGHAARECQVEWIRDVADQCREHKIPVFVKQMGAKPMVTSKAGVFPLPLRHEKGEDVRDFPPDLRVQEFPDLEHGDTQGDLF
jgi:protein gp37